MSADTGLPDTPTLQHGDDRADQGEGGQATEVTDQRSAHPHPQSADPVAKAFSLEDMLLRDEGVRLTLYADTQGVPTIGVGRNLRDQGLTHDEALYLLHNDIARVQYEVGRDYPWVIWMVAPRKAVMHAMAFQLGLAGLAEFHKFLAAAKGQYWTAASAEMLDSEAAKQAPERWERMAKQMESGAWQ